METKRNYVNRNLWAGSVVILILVALASCQNESRGFVLPEGDVVKGKQTFVDMDCKRCHSIADVSWSGNKGKGDPHIKLGGEVTAIKTYGELVTSVINPSHKISKQGNQNQTLTDTLGASKMELYKYNEVMTVEELVNLITFLQSEYKLAMPQNPYPYQGF